ncbi:MAG: cupin domain-containing protein [Actinobacteria bacterium]|nr:cupin domain-containing protein [Actinomycetota bacterium]
MSDNNIWSGEWGEQDEDWSGGGGRGKRLPRGGKLGATVYELDPGNFVVYHFHHRWEELLIVLRGRPTLRSPEGERTLAEGEVVHFPVGPAGAHALRNETDSPVRVVMASTQGGPEVAEYPDLGQITAQARTGSQTGDQLWLIYDVPPSTD